MLSLELKSKHNHCRCSKLCPFFLNYEKFLSTWLSILVLFVFAIMSIPLVKDPNFRRKMSIYFCKVKCYARCMMDKVKTSIGQLWSRQEGNRIKAKNAIANKKKKMEAKVKSDKKSNEEKKKMEKKYGKPPPGASKRDRSPSTSKERSLSIGNDSKKSTKSLSNSSSPPKGRKSSQKSNQSK